MRNIERKSIKYLIIQILSIAIIGIILYPLFDLIICKFLEHTEFIYSISDHIIEPIIVGCIAGTILWILGKKGSR